MAASQPASAVCLALPYPPTVNTYWRNIGRGRTILSAGARSYRAAVAVSISQQHAACPPMDGPIRVTLIVHPPDRRRRDLDNLLKPLLDALTHNLVIYDDSLIDELVVTRGERVPGGLVNVRVEPCAEVVA